MTRGMSRAELVKRSGVSDQQLSRLENGLFRLRLDHLKPFVDALGYSPEQILREPVSGHFWKSAPR
jgi:transcriptional regulator with XRE-family HTH domain